jgi:hypothetical protein
VSPLSLTIIHCSSDAFYLPSYLPAFPYRDNPLLHLYAGLSSLYLSHPTPPSAENAVDGMINPPITSDFI